MFSCFHDFKDAPQIELTREVRSLAYRLEPCTSGFLNVFGSIKAGLDSHSASRQWLCNTSQVPFQDATKRITANITNRRSEIHKSPLAARQFGAIWLAPSQPESRGTRRGTFSQYCPYVALNFLCRKSSSAGIIAKKRIKNVNAYRKNSFGSPTRHTIPSPKIKLPRYMGFLTYAYGPPVTS